MMDKRKSDFDRRSGVGRRLIYDLDYFYSGGTERRLLNERRSNVERRSAWLRISKHSSVCMIGADEINILNHQK